MTDHGLTRHLLSLVKTRVRYDRALTRLLERLENEARQGVPAAHTRDYATQEKDTMSNKTTNSGSRYAQDCGHPYTQFDDERALVIRCRDCSKIWSSVCVGCGATDASNESPDGRHPLCETCEAVATGRIPARDVGMPEDVAQHFAIAGHGGVDVDIVALALQGHVAIVCKNTIDPPEDDLHEALRRANDAPEFARDVETSKDGAQ